MPSTQLRTHKRNFFEMEDDKKRGYIQNILYWKLSPNNDHLLNSLLVLIAYRCFDGKSYSGKFFELNKSLEIYFDEPIRKFSTVFSLLILYGWIIPLHKNRKSRKREFRLSEKTIKLIFSETRLVLSKEIDLGDLEDSNLKDIVKINHVHSKNQPCDIVEINQLKRSNKENLKKNSLNGQRESFEKNQIEINGGNKFIEAIEQNGLMPEFQKTVSQYGRNPEKDTIPLIKDWANMDNNRLKRFSPKNLINRFNGAMEKGFIPTSKSKQDTPTRIKGGTLI